MRLSKWVVGVVLGFTLVSGVSGTAEAKTKPITVTVDTADAATAQKVDAAFKKGKSVVLKVRGSKKESKKLLIETQKAVADTLKYHVYLDLDNGNKSCEGSGNKFHTYKDLKYKQSGSYGCYTFSKSTCNAYKYAFKFIKGNVDKHMKSVKKRYEQYKNSYLTSGSRGDISIKNYKENMTDYFELLADRFDINEATYKFYEDLVQLYMDEAFGDAPDGSVDKLIEEALANGAQKKIVNYLVTKAKKCELTKPEPFMTEEEYIRENYGTDTLKFYKGGSLELDFTYSDNLTAYASLVFNGMSYGGLAGYIDLDPSRKMRAYELMNGTDEFRFKSLAKDVGHGVCADYAYCTRAVIDYLGHVSYYVENMKADHAVCAVSNGDMIMVFDNNMGACGIYSSFSTSESDMIDVITGLDYLTDTQKEYMADKERIYNVKSEYDRSGWTKCFKDAMGNDYPF